MVLSECEAPEGEVTRSYWNRRLRQGVRKATTEEEAESNSGTGLQGLGRQARLWTWGSRECAPGRCRPEVLQTWKGVGRDHPAHFAGKLKPGERPVAEGKPFYPGRGFPTEIMKQAFGSEFGTFSGYGYVPQSARWRKAQKGQAWAFFGESPKGATFPLWNPLGDNRGDGFPLGKPQRKGNCFKPQNKTHQSSV